MSDRMKTKLLELREELESLASTTDESAGIVELDQSKVGRLSRIDAIQAQAMAKASVDRRKAMLTRISAALQRIEDGAYGVCQTCEESINPKRLEADPTALYCLDCATHLEG